MLDRLQRLGEWPAHGQDVRQLRGELDGFYRLRSGGYRALFTVLPDQEAIVVERISPRGGAYD
jgi:mRNA-degrading endonuclease RelE of RelBE toxin-antitoxin system